MATMTLMGLCEYAGTDWLESALHEGLPAEFLARVSAENIAEYVILENAELEVLYPDPDMMSTAVALWAQSMQRPWARAYKAMVSEYDPLWNTDRHETEDITEDETRDLTDNSTGSASHEGKSGSSEKTTDNGTTEAKDTTAETGSTKANATVDASGEETGTTKTGVSAYNSGSYAPKDMQDTTDTTTSHSTSDSSGESSRDETGTHTGSTSSSGTSEASGSESISESHTGQDKHTGTIGRTHHHEHRAWGNIGITTSQQMLKEELDIAPFLNFEKLVADDFRKRFCLLVY